MFGALGDTTRLAIISRLQDGSEQSVSNLCSGLTLTRQGVTRHLHVLEQAGIVHSQRVGRETRYQLQIAKLTEARDYLANASLQWDDALERLSKHIEG